MSVIGQNGQCRRFYTYGIVFGQIFAIITIKGLLFARGRNRNVRKYIGDHPYPGGIDLLLLIQPPLSWLKSPLWGAIVPLVIVAAGVYAFGVAKLPLTFSGVIVLVLLLWTLLDWRRGRQIYHAKQAAGDGKAS